MNAVLDASRVREIEFSPNCRVNVDDETLLKQIEVNIRRGLPQAMPYQPNEQTAVIVCGGPSLNLPDVQKDLIKAVWAGGKVVAVNGAYNWCIERNIRPSAMVLMDAREFNSRFVERPVDECHYLLSSQCHPRAFELCQGRQTTIWHALSAGDRELEILDDYYFTKSRRSTDPEDAPEAGPRHHYPITLGTTVSLRAISLMRMLGFTSFEIFGLDSCVLDSEHHAYTQPENNNERTIPVWVRPEGRDDLARRFICSVWQAKQAEDFMQLVKDRGEMFQLNVHGPGLIATMIRTGAELEMEK
jgi:hypothetical protein